MKSQVSNGASPEEKKKAAEKERRAAEKKAAEDAKREAAELFKPVLQTQKVPFGVDPKSVVCTFFKQGACDKGIYSTISLLFFTSNYDGLAVWGLGLGVLYGYDGG